MDISARQKDLIEAYVHFPWYKRMVDQENIFLLKALNASHDEETKKYLKSFSNIRLQRREKYHKVKGFDISEAEMLWEAIEGSARYIETRVFLSYKTSNKNKQLQKYDSSYNSNTDFKNYSITDQQWLFDSTKSNKYFYATGFNIIRLLDKLNIQYKNELFVSYPDFLEKYLKNI